MNNFKQPGNILNLVAPAGGVVSGVAQLRGTVLVIPTVTAGEGQPFAAAVEGVFDLPCATGTAWEAVTSVLYWDNGNKRVTTTATNNTKIGFAAENKAAASAAGPVRLAPTI